MIVGVMVNWLFLFLASLLIYSKFGGTSESDDFLLSVLSWFHFVFHSHLLMIIAYDVNKHIIALSELLFTAWEVIDIFLFILALWSLSMIVGCDDRLYIVSSERMPYSQRLRSQAFGSPVCLSFWFNYVHWSSFNSINWSTCSCKPEEEIQQRPVFSCFGSLSNLRFIVCGW